MIRKRLIVCLIAAVMSCTCLFAFTACGSSDANDLVGEWKIKDTDVTVVFSGDKFKLVGNTFDYTVDPGAKTITYKSGDATGSAKYSFSDNAKALGAPENFRITVRELKVSAGAHFVVALTGSVLTMPGLPKVPAAENIDVDNDGNITGLF